MRGTAKREGRLGLLQWPPQFRILRGNNNNEPHNVSPSTVHPDCFKFNPTVHISPTPAYNPLTAISHLEGRSNQRNNQRVERRRSLLSLSLPLPYPFRSLSGHILFPEGTLRFFYFYFFAFQSVFYVLMICFFGFDPPFSLLFIYLLFLCFCLRWVCFVVWEITEA